MPTLEIFTTPIRDKIHACESQQEAWKRDHDMAMLVFRFEDLLGDMVELYASLDRVDGMFRRLVIDNPNSYCEEQDRTQRELHREYHYVAESVEVTATSIEADYHRIENIQAFRTCLKKARQSAKKGYQLAAIGERDRLQSEVSELLNGE